MGGPELTLAQKVLLLELNKIGLPRHLGVNREVVDAQIVELGLLGAVRMENHRVCAVPSTAGVAPALAASPEGSFLRDFVRAKRRRWNDEYSGLVDDLRYSFE